MKAPKGGDESALCSGLTHQAMNGADQDIGFDGFVQHLNMAL
jgi:hypothetical protein